MSVRPSIDPLLVELPGHTDCLLGNEAIVRGALEAGVRFACGYPGTPSSEITDSFARIAPAIGLVFEYSVNEKICLEMAFAASLAGARAICAMKHLGLMYGGDPLSTMPYIGAVGGLVIVAAADPSCLTSPNEQDQRHLARMLGIPMLEPSTPQEALDQTRFAFLLSERSELPVILRPTTRICHTRAGVRFGPLAVPGECHFKRNPTRFNPLPANARRLRIEMKERLKTAARMVGEAGLLRSEGSGSRAILAIGAPAATCSDLLAEADAAAKVRLLTLGVAYPLPEEELLEQLEGVEQLLVLEELSPFIEDTLTALLFRRGRALEVLGKRSGHTPEEFEMGPEVIRKALDSAFGLVGPPEPAPETEEVPARPPSLCPGCPHRSSFFAVRSAFDDEQLYFNDIGCYTLGGAPPLLASDALLSMGAGFTLAAGVARVTGEQTVGFMGDSTFFHSGMPALLNAIKENVNMVAVILDNEVTAMTGFQASPTVTVQDGKPSRSASIEKIVRALGASHVERVDPEDLPRMILAYRRAYEVDGVGVVIAERTCPNFLNRISGAPRENRIFEIDHEKCGHCGREARGTRCGQSATVAFSRRMATSRSLECGSFQGGRPEFAPCAAECPLELCVQGYAAHIANGRYAEALELIMERLPLPESVCRVCERPCEKACVRAGQEGPVAINDLKRFVVEWADRQESFPYRPEAEPENGLSVAVVGAGPAGLSAAHELRLRGYEVTLFDAHEEPGGLLRYGIPRYRLPREALDRDVGRILGLGIRFEGGARFGKERGIDSLLYSGFDAVCLAVGATLSKVIDLPSEPGGPEVLQALVLLLDARDGQAAFAGRRVVVVGGGNSAVDASRTALRLGASQVSLVCLESREQMPAIRAEVEEADQEGVRVLAGRKVLRLVRSGVKCARVEPMEGEFDPARATTLPGTEHVLDADLVVLALGQSSDRSSCEGRSIDLEWTEGGALKLDLKSGVTSHPKIFACGDLASGPATVTGAVASGLRAAAGIDAALRGSSGRSRPAPPPVEREPGCDPERAPSRHDVVERSVPGLLPVARRQGTFEEVVGPLTEEAARREAARCMICGMCGNCSACLESFGCPAFYLREGRILIDEALCVGCGVCAEFCPNGAIRVREAEGVRV
ncbi:MAG: FAD-dependent oxidoreductase [Planctomycetota bacterium]